MKFCVAQTRSARGDMEVNINRHISIVEKVAAGGAEVVVFPELSLTGYEPTLAAELAVDVDDRRLDDFQWLADAQKIVIGVGVPTRLGAGICISMLIFRPNIARQIYSKQYLHPDEDAYFVGGQGATKTITASPQAALAICFEISVPGHAKAAAAKGAELYIASVAKFPAGIDKSLGRLSEIARQNSMCVLMANCVGAADGQVCAGRSSVWDSDGVLLGQLDGEYEGALIFDSETRELARIDW